jgi:hypothetical protein
MKYRRLSESWDYTFGNGQGNYLSAIDAVGQAIRSRLLLFLGEWWMDTNDGLPLWQAILGIPGSGNNKVVVDRLIVERILGTPNVTSITGIDSTYDPDTRAYGFTAQVDTVYGAVAVSNVPFIIGRTMT